MKVCPGKSQPRDLKSASGFTLAEALVATLAGAVMLLALYASFTYGFATMRVTREDIRATQIIIQRMEAIRLSPYAVVANPAMFPTNTTAYFDESQNSTNHGTVYTVSFNATPGPTVLPTYYRTNVMLVTVSASWTSGNLPRSRSMQTYVARNGIQNYVAGN
jgi:Tfp pilus assembly protein PilV